MNSKKIKIGIIAATVIGIVAVVVIVILLSYLPTFIHFDVAKKAQRIRDLKIEDIKTITLSNYSSSTANKFMVIQKGRIIEIKDKNTINKFCQTLKSLKGISVNHPEIIGECQIKIEANKNISFDIFITSEGKVFAVIKGGDGYNNRISDEFTSFIRDVIIKSKERNPTWIFPKIIQEKPIQLKN